MYIYFYYSFRAWSKLNKKKNKQVVHSIQLLFFKDLLKFCSTFSYHKVIKVIITFQNSL